MPTGLFQLIRLAWFLALGAMLSSFRDAWWLTRGHPGRRYVRSAARERILLGIIEALLVAGALISTHLLHGADAITALGAGGLGDGVAIPLAGSTDALTAGRVGDAATDPLAASTLPTVTLAILGVVLAIGGAVLVSASKRALGMFFTANLGVKENHTLVTTGPYSLVRHPIYLGILLFTLGSGLVFDRGAIVLLAGALVPCLLVQARIEDRLFAAHFGAEHDAYRSRVPALLPWPRRS
jgi:protein-S-isoprenylcysteine O-methyltransferase Ste14